MSVSRSTINRSGKGRKANIDKLISALILRPSGLILEDDVVIPPAFHAEVLWVEKWIAPGNVIFALFLRLCSAFLLLETLVAS